jgi:hypothetical protein
MDSPAPFRFTPAFVGFVLAAALAVALCSVIVSQTESDSSVGGRRVVQLGYGLPVAFTSATTTDTIPFNIFAYLDQAANPAHWRPFGYLADTLLWFVILAIVVGGRRLSLSLGTFVGLVVVGLIFLALLNLVFTFG